MTLENAQSILDQSKALYKDRKFQSSIASATITVEESLKGIELIWSFKRHESLARDNWEKLKSHIHKLTHVREKAVNIMEKTTKEEEVQTLKELEEQGFIGCYCT